MAKIAIIVGHARSGTYCEALGEAYRRGAVHAGDDVWLFVTARMMFDPVLHEGFARLQPLEADLRSASRIMTSATLRLFSLTNSPASASCPISSLSHHGGSCPVPASACRMRPCRRARPSHPPP